MPNENTLMYVWCPWLFNLYVNIKFPWKKINSNDR